jgi:copper(I)-binding protein
VRVSPLFRRSIAAAALALTLGPLAAGCGVGFDSGTTETQPDYPGGQVGNINVQNVLIVAAEDAEQAVLSMAIVNNGDSADTLTGVEVEGAREATVSGGELEIPAGGQVIVGSPDGPSITVTRNGEKPALGEFTELTLNFAPAGQLKLQAPVVPATGPYASLTPQPTPSPTARPTEAGLPTPTETGLPTPTAR